MNAADYMELGILTRILDEINVTMEKSYEKEVVVSFLKVRIEYLKAKEAA